MSPRSIASIIHYATPAAMLVRQICGFELCIVGEPRIKLIVVYLLHTPMFKRAYFFLQTLETPTLQNVSFAVRSEQLLAVIGPVGAGKVRSVVKSQI